MSLPDIPDDVLTKIVRLIGEDRWWFLGPILRAGRKGRNLVFREEVLKHAQIFNMCADPGDIVVGGRYRSFFCRCLGAGNKIALYYEGLRLVTEVGDIKGAITLLNYNVPEAGDATFACAVLSICDGDEAMAVHYLQIFNDMHQRLGTEGVRLFGEDLFKELSLYRVTYNNSYRSTFQFPKGPFIPSPTCAISCGILSRGDEILCNQCYLWWFSRQVCMML